MEEVEGLEFRREDGVATVMLNRPEKQNALTFKMIKGVTDFVEECGWDEDVRAIVITGAGRAFSSGDDIVGGMGERSGPPRVPLSMERSPHYRMIKTMMSTPKPVIAAINGRCHGAGWVMALSCDFRVAKSDALIGDIRSGKAIFANQGVGLMLPRLIGASRAMDMLVTGRVIEATEAERFGIVVRVWDAEGWETNLSAFVHDIASGPTRNYAAWKLSVNRSALMELDSYTDFERLLNMALAGSEDAREGVQAFREKREPRFTGR
jgi:2-(1,2-epoxy-1,2-dihydrophenyl)acetyl-CoA isomerase